MCSKKSTSGDRLAISWPDGFALALFSFLAFALVVAYWGGIVEMWRTWSHSEEYGYGYFIPVIAAYLIYRRKHELLSEPFAPTWAGVLVMLVAVFAYLLGEVATTYTLVQYSLVLLLMGFALALVGWRAFRYLVGPLALLFFMVPLPPFVLNTLSGHLQLISSEIGVWVIRLFGISVFLEGNVIDLGNYQLQVVEACSGLNYLFPLMSLAFILAYLYKVEFWKRAVLFLSSIPITVLMNSFRIGMIGWLVENWGIEQADGFLHFFEGWVVFMACLAILLAEVVLLSRVGGRRMKLSQVLDLDWPKRLPPDFTYPALRVGAVHGAVLATLVLLVVSSLYVDRRAEVRPERLGFEHFPLQVGDWVGREDRLEQIFLDALKLDDYLMTDFRRADGGLINFYVAYYGSQQAGSAAHSPRACIPGGGWQIDELEAKRLPELRVDGQPLVVNRLIIKRGDTRQLVYYWFQQRGRVITSEYLVKWYLFYDAVTRNRTDGALVRVTTPVDRTEDWSDGDRRLQAFIREALPLLDGHVPD